ncbi:hypothetical protein BDC45DRAFT_60221 [Circinella umbellata]|nr:hypothetical protein BDC45DRAFT_60221 [Circinella umbellata]
MDDCVLEYLRSLEESNVPKLKDYIDTQRDDIMEVFIWRKPTTVTSFYDVKSFTISEFKKRMESRNITNYIMNKRDVDWDSLTTIINRIRCLIFSSSFSYGT